VLPLLLVLTGCGKAVEFRPHDYDFFYRHKVLILEATPLPPLPEEIQKQVENRVEKEFEALPYFAHVVSRQAARDSLAGDRATRSRYDLLSDVTSVLAIAERELTLGMAKSQQVDFVATIQALHLPCPHCDKSDRVAVIAQMFEVNNAQLVWRASVSRDVASDADATAIGAAVDDATGELLEIIEHQFKPKWQRLRFLRIKGEVPDGEVPGGTTSGPATGPVRPAGVRTLGTR
jgi:hypothetical protein